MMFIADLSDRSKMPDGAGVLIKDAVLPEGNEPHFGRVIDLEMLMLPGGMERTAPEYETLLANSDLRLTRIIPKKSRSTE